jgi:hypothetical protein
MSQLFYLPSYQALSSSGTPLGGAKLSFFLTGTTTAAAVYADAARTTPLPSPVVADAQGRFPQIYPDSAIVYRARLTDSSNVQQWQEDGLSLQLFPRTQAEISASVTPTNYSYEPGDIRRYGAVSGAISAAALQAAINSLGANGGDVYVPAGDFTIEATINLADRRSIRIRGESEPTGGAAAASILRLTQTSGSRIFDCRSTAGVVFENLMILQTGSGFAGHVLDYDHSAAASDSAFAGVRNSYVQGVATALSLVNLHKAISSTIEGNHLVGADCAILGGGADYANRINVVGNEFKEQVTAPIKNPGVASQSWMISGNTFEGASGSKAAAIFADGGVTGLVFSGNWLGDANTTGSWIKVAAMSGSAIFGNFFSTGDKAIEFTGALGDNAVAIFGNSFVSLGTALHIPAGAVWYGEYVNNFFLTVTNALVGTPAGGRYQAGNNATVQHRSDQVLSAGVANGIGGTLGGVLWTIMASSAIGQVIKGSAAQSADLAQWRNSADAVLAAVTATGALQMREQSDPATPAGNNAHLYVRDNGSGKTQLCVRWDTGSITVLATEP